MANDFETTGVLYLFKPAHEMDNALIAQQQLFMVDGVPALERLQTDKLWRLWSRGIWTTVTDGDIDRLLAKALGNNRLIVRNVKRPPLEDLDAAEVDLETNGGHFIARVHNVRTLRDGLRMVVPNARELSKADERHIVMRNGVYDVVAGKLVGEPSPRYPHTWKLDYDYDPKATCPNFDRYINDICRGQPNTKLFLQEHMGVLASGRTDLQKALYLMGVSGSGKSTYEKICTLLVGAENKAAADGNTDKHVTASWVGKKLISFADMRSVPDPRKFSELLLKVIGQDSIPVEAKYQDRKTAVIDANVIVCSNTVLPLKDEAGVAPKRFMGVYLEHAFRGTSNEDTELSQKLAAEMSGVFNWAMQGLQRLNAQGRFTVPETHDRVLDRLLAASTSTFDFYDEALVVTGDLADVLSTHDVSRAMQQWLTLSDIKVPAAEKSLDGIEDFLSRTHGVECTRPKGLWKGKKEQPRCLAGVRFSSVFEHYRGERSIIAEHVRNAQARRGEPKTLRAAIEPIEPVVVADDGVEQLGLFA